MTLPYDVSRCNGVGFEDEGGDGWIWREGCDDCRRREPGQLDGQSYISPPIIIAFECEYRIPKEQT